jgi:hypothetical protein
MSADAGPAIRDALVALNEEGIRVNNTIQIVELPDEVTKPVRDEIDDILKSNKPRKGKRGKKGKGKKGKKKKKKS